MKEITIKKSKLVDKINENMTIHVKEYKELHILYTQEAILRLQVLLQNIQKNSHNVSLYVDLVEPTSSEDSYRTALEMLELEVNENVTISEQEFKQYIKDEWHWSRSFELSKSAYLK